MMMMMIMLISAASPRVDISSTCKVGQKIGISLPLDMLPFGVTISATVPQRSEIPERLMNYPVFITYTRVLFINMKEGILNILLKLYQHYVETANAINLSTFKHSFPIHVLKRDVMKSFITQTLISVLQKGRQFYARLMKCSIFGARYII